VPTAHNQSHIREILGGIFASLRAFCSLSPLCPGWGGGCRHIEKEGETSQNPATLLTLCDCWRYTSHVKIFDDRVT